MRSKKNRRRIKAAVSVRQDRSERLPLGERALAAVKRASGYDNVRKWHEVRTCVIVGCLALVPAIAWAFWPTLLEMMRAWNHEPDYSHGFLIPPLAVYFLWARRERFRGWSQGPVWAGLVLVGASLALRYVGAYLYLGSVDGWALVLAIAGAVWATCGTRVYWFSLPSIVFLFFAVPLPFRVERGLSLTLQGVAAKLSTWILQLLGQPALAEGNTILLGETHLEVEHACSGMRIFLGIFAVAFAYIVIVRRAWWEKALIAAAVVPIALAANAVRVVATGLLFQWVSGEAAMRFSHDFAGWVMIPLAALMFALLLGYLRLLFREVEVVDSQQMIRGSQS